MNPLKELRDHGIPITWKTVAIGLEGPGSAPPQIGLPEVRSWLEASLASGEELDGSTDILMAIDADTSTRQVISQLPPGPAAGSGNEVRKWQWLMLRRQLDKLPSDPFYAALELADFWSQFGKDPNLPTPSKTDLIAPLTRDDRARLIRRQEAWLAATKDSFQSNSGPPAQRNDKSIVS